MNDTQCNSFTFNLFNLTNMIFNDQETGQPVESRWSTVGDVQVLHQCLVVCCHGNCLFKFAIWSKLKHSANLKDGKQNQGHWHKKSKKKKKKRRYKWIISTIPVAHVAPWQKRFWLKSGSAGSAAALSAPPPQSPPDLHKRTPLTQNGWSVCCVKSVYFMKQNWLICLAMTLLSHD